MLILAAKIVVSVAMVVGVTVVAERASPRLAGVLLGFPLGAGLTLFFFGVEQGAAFAAESALWSVPGILATLSFSWGYRQGLQRLRPPRPAACTVAGLVGFFAAALALRHLLPESQGVRALATALALGGFAIYFRSVPLARIGTRVRLTPRVLAARASIVTALVLAITGLAQAVGPQWSGLFSTFPTTLLPAVLILHVHYGPAPVATLFRDLPLGLVAIVVFAYGVHLSFPAFGVYLGTAASYALAALYLVAYERWLKQWADRLLKSVAEG